MTAPRALAFWTIFLAAGCGGGTSGPESAAVAKWVIEQGGTVRLSGRNVPLRAVDEVPEEPVLIEEIDLTDADVTDKELEHLTKLTQLQRLRLYGTDITDEGLRHLTGFEELKELELSQTRITDKGLSTLAALKGLEKLYLYNTAVTKKGVESLQQQLPDTTIYY